MRSSRVGVAVALAVGAALVFAGAGCGGEKSDAVVVGHAACLSGKHAKAGEQAVAGIRAAVDWVNDVHGGVLVDGKRRPLEYRFYDCESRKESVTSLLERLITVDRVDVVVAPYSSGLTLAGAPVAEKHGIVYLDHGGASDILFDQEFDYLVQTIGPGSRYHVGTLDLVRKIDPTVRRLALAYKDDEFARSVMDGAVAHAKKLGFEIVFQRTYPADVQDLTPMLSDLKAADPEIVLGGGHLLDGQLLTRQLADLGVDPRLLSLIAAVTLPAFGDALGETAEGMTGPSHWETGVSFSRAAAEAAGERWFGPDQADYIARFRKASGADLTPDYHAAEAGASVLALVLAVEDCGSLDSDEIRRALGDLTFTSFYGRWDIDDRGMQIGHAMVDVQWQDGKRRIVWPEAARDAEVRYPKPAFR